MKHANLVVAMLAIALSCAPARSQQLSPDSALAPLVRQYQVDDQSVRTYFDLRWSSARLDAQEQLARRRLAELNAVPFDTLDSPARADAVLLRFKLEDALSSIAIDRSRLAEMRPLLPHLPLLEQIETLRSEMTPLDLPALAAQFSAVPEQIRQVRARIVRSGEQSGEGSIVVSPSLALRTASASEDALDKLERWNRHYRDFVPEFGWWMDKPIAAVRDALRDYHHFLRADLAAQRGDPGDPLVGDPAGRERLVQELRREMIAYTPEELIAIGQRELAWCQAELRAASLEMGLGDDFLAAIEKVKQQHVPPGEQAGYITRQAEQAIAFVSELVTVPDLCARLWRTQMIPAHDQRIWPFAAYGDAVVMVSYATDEMDTAEKLMSMRGNNRHFTRIVVPHELIPGHHLQRYVHDRVRPYRRAFETPFFVEGWALYWEFELWDRGYAQTPEDRVGMLFWRSHRAARIITSLQFHLGQITPEQWIDFLVTQVGHERASAVGEVRRSINGMYSPLYQVAYMIGGIQIRALRDESVGQGRLSQRAFNDALIQQGPIPVEIIRAQMLDLPIEPGFEPSWRFDEH
ncbi:MAG: DUF885 domain-containing protein [Leptolyngbya sp. PLA3]|nr:MAG: DUF885 domain-containing protein [Cyanobacteria bacterium CYA]MCE7969404.1 DUF885 domain-containing protein [Leptolyngbya sp. PL-A3]